MQLLRTIWHACTARPRNRAALALSIVLLSAVWPIAAHADVIEEAVYSVLGWIFLTITNILGTLLITFIDILVWIAQYNDFINTPAVNTGWTVTRDIANMFFIVALLLISIGTVFRIQEYRYTSMLRKLIMMAILINFSKTIAAFFIDLSQVVMLTFVNAFKDMAAGNLTQGFGIEKIVSFSKTASASGGDINFLSVLGALFAAVLMLFVALVVVGIFVILLAQRIVMLWIYIVLAPTAYMVAVLPGSLGSWWSSWWRDFTQYLIRGPVIAFFLWLALTIISVSNSVTGNSIINTNTPLRESGTLGGTNITNTNSRAYFASEATTSANIINYIIAIGMLVAGLQQATKATGVAGNVASKWMGNLNKWGGAMATSPIRGAQGLLKRPAYDTAGGALGGAAAVFSSRGLAWTGLGSTFGKMNARLTRKRQKSEEKDSDWINYADERTVRNLATSNFSLTEGGRIDSKIARERILQKGELRNFNERDRERIVENYRRDIGHRYERDPRTNDLREVSTDAPGAKILNDAIAKDPSILAQGWDTLDPEVRNYRTRQMQRVMSRMSAADIGKMDAGAWSNTHFIDAVLNDRASQFPQRFLNENFRRNLSQTLPGNVLANLNQAIQDFVVRDAASGAARFTGPEHTDMVNFQEDIDTDRQQRTAAKIREFEQRGKKADDFFTSTEYTQAAPGTYFGQRDYLANVEQAERRRKNLERQNADEANATNDDIGYDAEAAGEKSAELTNESYVRGLESFGSGSSNMMAVTGKMLEEAGIKEAAGGHVRGGPAVQKLASVMRGQLNSELDAVNKELVSSTNVSERAVLEKRQAALQRAIGRLDKPEELGKLQFVNADRHGGNVWNLAAEEKVHEKLDTIDPDGSFRKQLMQQFSAQELENITSAIRSKTGDVNITTERAFEEYLSKGLVNTMGEKYKDSSTDAIKLRSDLPLLIKRQGEQQLAARENAGQKLSGAERRKHMINAQSLEESDGITATHEVPARSQQAPASSKRVIGVSNKEESVVEEPRAEAVTNITNVTQNISQAFNAAPASTRATLTGLTEETINNAFRFGHFGKQVINMLKNNMNALENTGVLTELGQKESTKRMNSLEKHLADGNAVEFKKEYGQLKDMLNGDVSNNAE